MDDFQWLDQAVADLPEPENIFNGLKMAADFALPDNILLFFHDFSAPHPTSHYRYTLVVPLDDMRYDVDDLRYDIRAGQLLLIRPYQQRFLFPRSPGYRRLFITFTVENEQSYIPEGTVFDLTAESMESLKRMLAAYRGAVQPELSLELYTFLKGFSPARRHTPGKKLKPLTWDTIRYVNEHLDSRLLNRDIALKLNTSLSTLRRSFREETGISLKRYIEKQRLAQAGYLLRNSSKRVDEIAAICGFATASAFSHFLKKHLGVSPLKYRSGG